MRYFITLVLITALIVLGVVLFGGTGGKKKPTTTNAPVKALYDLASTDTEVRYTMDGRINGDDAHRQIVITVGKDSRTIDIVQGYQGNVIKSQTFDNNSSAYDSFLHALEYAGYTKTKTTKTTDSAGVCAQGRRYIYETVGAKKDQNTWSTSCGGFGTFAGQPSMVKSLFTQQITGYDRITASVSL